MKIAEDLFTLSKEETETSKMIYNNKIIKCLVAPYHTYNQLEKEIKYTKNTFLFPERELSIDKLKCLISMIVASKSMEEYRIITANQNVIIDMVDACVRVLTEDERIVPSPVKTFMANIHDIRYSLLENEDHQISKAEKTAGVEKIQKMIEKVQSGVPPMSKADYDNLISEINLIGEPIIREKLKEMARENIEIK